MIDCHRFQLSSLDLSTLLTDANIIFPAFKVISRPRVPPNQTKQPSNHLKVLPNKYAAKKNMTVVRMSDRFSPISIIVFILLHLFRFRDNQHRVIFMQTIKNFTQCLLLCFGCIGVDMRIIFYSHGFPVIKKVNYKSTVYFSIISAPRLFWLKVCGNYLLTQYLG